MQFRYGVSVVSLALLCTRVSAHSAGDTAAVSHAVGVLLASRGDGRGDPSTARQSMRPGLLGRAADRAFDAALRAPGPTSPTLAIGLLYHRLTRLEWHADSVRVHVETEYCGPGGSFRLDLVATPVRVPLCP